VAIVYYHRNGKAGDFMAVMREWEAGHSIASDAVREYWISTIWLPIDHNWVHTGPPLRFETMVFKGDDMTDLDCRRYTSEADARAGHAELLAELRLLTQIEDSAGGFGV
jgi:hypothetical protein